MHQITVRSPDHLDSQGGATHRYSGRCVGITVTSTSGTQRNARSGRRFPMGSAERSRRVRGGLTMDENESRVRLAILAGYGDELPRAVESAILYEVDLLMTNPTVYVLRSASICERAHVRDFK